MKKEIINYFENDRSFRSGTLLYHRYGNNLMFTKKFKLQGETPLNIQILHYQLWKLTGEPEGELTKILNNPINNALPEQNIQSQMVDAAAFDPDQPRATDEASELPEGNPTVPEAVKFKIREEFPFLSRPDCPDSLKILIADMFTAHENFCNSHEKLYNVTNTQEAFTVANDTIQSYLANGSIWKELNHYKVTGNILGEHPYFDEQNRRKKLMELSIPELFKLKSNITMNLWRNKNKLNDNPALLKSRASKIEFYERDLKIVISLLDIQR